MSANEVSGQNPVRIDDQLVTPRCQRVDFARPFSLLQELCSNHLVKSNPGSGFTVTRRPCRVIERIPLNTARFLWFSNAALSLNGAAPLCRQLPPRGHFGATGGPS